jgi:hypothetical protein
MLNSPPVPPRTLTTRKYTPHQDIFPPSTSFNPPQLQNTFHTSNDSQSSKAPIVPPGPPRLASNNTPHSNKSKPAPPPPIRTNSHNSSVPAPPPPPLPANLFNPNSIPPVTLNGSSASSSNTNQNSLLDEICSFNKEQFKVYISILVYFLIEFLFQSALQRPTPPIKSPENNEKLNAHHTIEENIRILLDKRRQDISKTILFNKFFKNFRSFAFQWVVMMMMMRMTKVIRMMTSGINDRKMSIFLYDFILTSDFIFNQFFLSAIFLFFYQ